jgi:2,4-dienoyl-CoA reductase-like NADH-dependent reductase (Old Yellow Enzyme family)/thioredoxin reductase
LDRAEVDVAVTNARFSSLFSPGRIGVLDLPNRVVVLPIGARLAHNGRVSDRERAFYASVAAGGAGLVVLGAAFVHRTSKMRGWFIRQMYDLSDEDKQATFGMISSMQGYGCKVFGQLAHIGGQAPYDNDSIPVGPSSVRPPGSYLRPKELSTSEVRDLVDAFANSAYLLQETGHDGVEVQANHGTLVSQFLSPATNRRSDAYTGSTVEGRARFLIEIVNGIRDRCGRDWPIGVRFSADEEVPSGIDLNATLKNIDILQREVDLDYLSVTLGIFGSYVKDGSVPEAVAAPHARAIKAIADVPVLVGGRIQRPELADEIIRTGGADFVGIGRGFIADPDWALKAGAGHVDQIRPCASFVQDCRLSAGGVTCAVNARVGRELDLGPRHGPTARRSCRVVVVGGGPGGLEAARVAREDGHSVILYEASDTLGGQIAVAGRAPHRNDLLSYVRYLEAEIRRLGVDVRMGRRASADTVLDDAPDVAIIATGSSPGPIPVPVSEGAIVMSVSDVLTLSGHRGGARVVVVDDGSGGWDVMGATEHLSRIAENVTLVTPAAAPGSGIPYESLPGLLRRLRQAGVEIRAFSHLAAIHKDAVEVRDVHTGESASIPSSLVAIKLENQVNDELIRELAGRVAVTAIGDCVSPRKLTHAILEANLAIRDVSAGTLGGFASPAASCLHHSHEGQ